MKHLISFAKEECEKSILYRDENKVAFRWFRTWQSIEKVEDKYRLRYFAENQEMQPTDLFSGEFAEYENEIKSLMGILMQKCFLGSISISEKWWKLLSEAGEKLWCFRDDIAQKYVT